MRLLRLLSIVSRRRWPKEADPAPAIGVPPPKKKKAAAPAADAKPKSEGDSKADTEPKADAPSAPSEGDDAKDG